MCAYDHVTVVKECLDKFSPLMDSDRKNVMNHVLDDGPSLSWECKWDNNECETAGDHLDRIVERGRDGETIDWE